MLGLSLATVARRCTAPSLQRLTLHGLSLAVAVIWITACSSSHREPISQIGSDAANSEMSLFKLVSRLSDASDPNVMVVAHRACWRNSAENSLDAIEQCVKLGVDMIEIDVRRTADGQLVLMHDARIDRTTTGRGAVSEMTLVELRIVRLRKGLGGDQAAPVAAGIPTLKEALEKTRGRILVNLDIKESVFDQCIELVESMGLSDQVLIKSSRVADDPVLTKQLSHSKAHFMPILRECNDDPDRVCSHVMSEALPAYRRFNPIAVEVVYLDDAFLTEGIRAAKANDLRIWVNTLGERFAAGKTDDEALMDPDSNWGTLIDVGVNMIQTDRPAALIGYLEARGLRGAQ